MTNPAHDPFEPTFLVGDLIHRPLNETDNGLYLWFVILSVVPFPESPIGHYKVWCLNTFRYSTISFMWADRNSVAVRP